MSHFWGPLYDGGYVYGYDKKPTGKTAENGADISFGGWAYQALKAVKSTGLEVDGMDECIKNSISHLKGLSKKSFPYHAKGRDNVKNYSLMAVGTLCLQLFDSAEGFKETDRMMDIIKVNANQTLDWDNPPKQAMYSWYYQTFASFQNGGDHWKVWNNKFQSLLKKNQNPEGFWEYPGNKMPHSDLTRRVHATTFACLMLTVYYRYLPSTSKKHKALKAKAVPKKAVMKEETVDIF